MEKAYSILKWIAVGLLFASLVVFLVIPYYHLGDESRSGLGLLQEATKAGAGYVFETVFRHVIPVLFCVIGGVVMIRASKGTCIGTAILAFLASLLNINALSQLREGTSDSIYNVSIGVGVYINFIISLIGFVIPIVLIIIEQKKTTE